MKVYITGCYKVNPLLGISLEYYCANNMPHYAFNVASHLYGMDDVTKDILTLIECDAIALLDGWQHSPNANMELRLSNYLRKEIIILQESEDIALLNFILVNVLAEYNIFFDDLISRKRNRKISDARWTFILLARQLTSLSSSHIGNFIGRDHATILYGTDKAKDLLMFDSEFREKYQQIINKLQTKITL